jgi:long-chain acyl-CoA synthetase
MNVARLLERNGHAYGERVALSVGAGRYATYRELARSSFALAHGLRARFHLSPGDRVAVVMTNRPEFWEVMFGIWAAGLVAVPINAKLHPSEFEYILSNSGARLCFVSPDLAGTVAPLAGRVEGLAEILDCTSAEYLRLRAADPGPFRIAPKSPSDVAWLFYTSGTTGRPKGAMITHRNLLVMIYSHVLDVDPVCCQDSVFHAAPVSHGSGMVGLVHFAQGGNNVFPESGGFDPAEVFALLRHHRGVSLFAAPTMVIRMCNAAPASTVDLANLRTIVYGGGPMYLADLRRGIEILGPRFAQIYGQGEAPMTITSLPKHFHTATAHPRYLERLASVGIPRTGVEVRVVDDGMRTHPAGEMGEVAVRGDIVMGGYWRNAEATASTIRDGWLRTGDVGTLDEEGFLTLRDRSKDMIISGGSNIYPREVEEVLLRHPGVLEASVVGRTHPEWGEEVVAFVVPRPGATVSERELDELCLGAIARFKRPRHYVFEDALPKNNYGKVLKTALRERLARPERPAHLGFSAGLP